MALGQKRRRKPRVTREMQRKKELEFRHRWEVQVGGLASCAGRNGGEKSGGRNPEQPQNRHRPEGHAEDLVLPDVFVGRQFPRQAAEMGVHCSPKTTLFLDLSVCPMRVWGF